MTEKLFAITSSDLSEETVFIQGREDTPYLYVTVKGKGVVIIKSEDDGIIVDIYPLDDDESVASTWANMHDLMKDTEEQWPFSEMGKFEDAK